MLTPEVVMGVAVGLPSKVVFEGMLKEAAYFEMN